MTQTHGPDVSEFQGNVDWPRVKQKNGGMGIIRTHTGYRPDHFSPIRRQAAEQAGIKVLGFYQYLVPQRPIDVQANEFCDGIHAMHAGQFAMADVEDDGFHGDISGLVDEWCSIVDKRLGYPGYNGSWVYSYGPYIASHGLARIFASSRHTILAAYQSQEPTSYGHSLWQHTSSGCIWLDGTVTQTSGCDCNIFDGTVDDMFKRVCGSAPPVPPQPKPAGHRFDGFSTLTLGTRDSRTGPLPAGQPPKSFPVHTLQYCLNAFTGNPHLCTWDGIYGSQTQGHVADFQRFWHMAVDGVVGPKTWAQLDVALAFKGL